MNTPWQPTPSMLKAVETPWCNWTLQATGPANAVPSNVDPVAKRLRIINFLDELAEVRNSWSNVHCVRGADSVSELVFSSWPGQGEAVLGPPPPLYLRLFSTPTDGKACRMTSLRFDEGLRLPHGCGATWHVRGKSFSSVTNTDELISSCNNVRCGALESHLQFSRAMYSLSALHADGPFKAHATLSK